MGNFFRKLISSSNEVSSRRFIAIILLPFFISGIIIGFVLSWKYNDFRYFLTSILAAAVPIMMAYFLLTWERVKDIVTAIGFNKKNQTQFFDDTNYIDTDSSHQIDESQLKDP